MSDPILLLAGRRFNVRNHGSRGCAASSTTDSVKPTTSAPAQPLESVPQAVHGASYVVRGDVHEKPVSGLCGVQGRPRSVRPHAPRSSRQGSRCGETSSEDEIR
jgi:hypothetical protein